MVMSVPDKTGGQLHTERESTARVSLEPHLVMETIVGEGMQVVLAERET